MSVIKIRGEEYQLKYTLRSHFLYEEITGTSFTPSKMLNVYTFLFCVLLANNDHFKMDFEDFINEIDENPDMNASFMKWMNDEYKKRRLMSDSNENEEDVEGDKKKA